MTDPAVSLHLLSVRPAVGTRIRRATAIVVMTVIAVVVSVLLPAAAITRGANIGPTAAAAIAAGTLLPLAIRTRVTALVLPVVLAVVVGAVVAPFWSKAIQRKAEVAAATIAGDQPYCVQVPQAVDGNRHAYGYRPIVEATELSGFRMQAPIQGGITDDFHAVLIVGADATARFYNWSYMAANFVRVSDSAVASLYLRVQCEPRVGFVAGLAR